MFIDKKTVIRGAPRRIVPGILHTANRGSTALPLSKLHKRRPPEDRNLHPCKLPYHRTLLGAVAPVRAHHPGFWDQTLLETLFDAVLVAGA